MRDKRQRILDDPEGYRQQQIARKLPEDFDELPDHEQQDLVEQLRSSRCQCGSRGPAARRFAVLTRLIAQARAWSSVRSNQACQAARDTH